MESQQQQQQQALLLQELTAKLHIGLAEELLSRLNHGEATTQDLNVIRQFLKDNNISAVAVAPDKNGAEAASPFTKLIEALPFVVTSPSNNSSSINHH